MKNVNALRLKKVIESDRLNTTAESSDLVLKDLEAVLNEYFHLSSKIDLSIKAEKGEYAITVKFCADALKSFVKLHG